MKTIGINMPITGSYYMEVEVEDDFDIEDEDAVADLFHEEWETGAYSPEDMLWEFTTVVAEGNVTHAELNDMEVSVI